MKARAARAGMTLSDYLLDFLRHAIERPEPDVLLNRVRERSRLHDGVAGGRSEGGARGALIVVDASAILEVLLRTGSAAALEARLFSGHSLHAPYLLDLEVAQVLRRYEQARELSAARGREALDDLEAFRIERYRHDLFMTRISGRCGRTRRRTTPRTWLGPRTPHTASTMRTICLESRRGNAATAGRGSR